MAKACDAHAMGPRAIAARSPDETHGRIAGITGMAIHPTDAARRGFLRHSAAAAGVLAVHDALAGLAKGAAPPPVAPARSPLIREIRLRCATPLEEMREFYAGRIGLGVRERGADRLVLAAGPSEIVFVREEHAGEGAKPFYHFAFNIPQNKILAAREWQLARSPLVPTPERLRDRDYPDDVRHFPHWNAHSVFFFDPAWNIVEYIARHDLKNDAPGGFTTTDLLCISEIGFVVEQPNEHARALHAALGLEAYPRGTDNWWAMGDEHGLVLCLPKGRVFGENTDTPKAFDVFPTGATIARPAPGSHAFAGHPYDLTAVRAGE